MHRGRRRRQADLGWHTVITFFGGVAEESGGVGERPDPKYAPRRGKAAVTVTCCIASHAAHRIQGIAIPSAISALVCKTASTYHYFG